MPGEGPRRSLAVGARFDARAAVGPRLRIAQVAPAASLPPHGACLLLAALALAIAVAGVAGWILWPRPVAGVTDVRFSIYPSAGQHFCDAAGLVGRAAVCIVA